MDSIFSILTAATQASQIANDLAGRAPYTTLGVVTDVDDPDDLRRVKATIGAKGGVYSTDWLLRRLDAPGDDPPLPEVGQTISIEFIDGNPHQGIYSVLVNRVNEPQDKPSAQLDHHTRVEGERVLKVGKSIRLQNDAGAYFELNEAGYVVLGDAFGHRWMLGGPSGTEWTWDAAGASINVINAQDFTIAGKSIATIGAKDSDNDTIVQRGW